MTKGTVERLDTAGFESAIQAMGKAVASYQNARQSVINITDPVMESWRGRGEEAFSKVYKKLKTEMEDDETNLITIKQDLENIKQSYEEWDASLANEMKSKE